MIEVEVSHDLKRILSLQDKNHVDVVLKKVRDKLGQQIINKIQDKGFAPRDTGKLAESHYIVSNNKETFIKTNRKANNGVPLWLYIVDGHRVLTTERSRRWWFWYLKNSLGGSYTRKTHGPPGYVPPDNYHERAVNTVSMNTVLQIIESELLK